MDPIIQNILVALFTGALFLWLGYRLGRSGERSDRHREFRAALRMIQSDVLAARNPAFYIAYTESINAVRQLIAKTTDDLPPSKRKRLNLAFDEFAGLNEVEVDVSREPGFMDDKTCPFEERVRKWAESRSNLSSHFDHMIDATR